MYDCFLFLNEIDVLKFRLKNHSPFVKKFVILESNTTFTGQERELQFYKHKKQFDNYSIDYYIYDGKTKKFSHPMEMEIDQRNFLKSCTESSGIMDYDNLMISDVDEIYETSKLKDLLQEQNDRPIRGFLHHNEYYVNLFSTKSWVGPWIGKYHKRLQFQSTRDIISEPKSRHIKSKYNLINKFCGFHLSSLYGNDFTKFLYKMKSYSHALQDNHKKYKSWNEKDYKNHIKDKILNNELKIDNDSMSKYWIKNEKYIYDEKGVL